MYLQKRKKILVTVFLIEEIVFVWLREREKETILILIKKQFKVLYNVG